MKKITVIVLAGKRQDMIEGCLKTLLWADEKILVSLEADNKTMKIAQKYGFKIVKGIREYNFSKWRNQGALASAGDWLIYVDSDERVTPDLKKEILGKINQDKEKVNGYFIPRKNYFLAKEFKSEWPDYQLRLIKKKALVTWRGNIHETPEIKGETKKLKNYLVHLSHRSIKASLLNTIKWSKLEAENRFKTAHPRMTSWRFIRIFLTGVWQFIKKRSWKEGVEGVIDGIYQLFSLFFTYVRLWEMQRGESLKKSYQKIDQKIQELWE